MRKQKPNRREGRLNRQYVDRRGREAVSYPAPDPMPEHIQLLDHRAVRDKKVRPVGRYWKQESPGQPMCPEGSKPRPRGGKPLYDRKGCIGQGQSASEVGGSGGVRREPVAKPPNFLFGGENAILKVDGDATGGGAFLRGPPMYELRFRDGEGEA